MENRSEDYRSKEDLKLEYEGNESEPEWTSEKSIEFMHNLAREYYADLGEETHPYKLEGLEMGIIAHQSDLNRGLIPDYIKNIKVQAVKSFERLLLKHTGYVAPQEYYNGFISGYLYGHQIHCDSL